MGTKFSLTDPNPGTWFPFDEDDPESGSVCVRVLNTAKRREIRKKAVKKRVEYKHGQRYEFEEADDGLYSELLWDYVIVDWCKLEDENGNPIECTTENKALLMRENVGFAMFINQCTEIVSDNAEQRAKAIEKNSMSGLSDNGKNQNATSAND